MNFIGIELNRGIEAFAFLKVMPSRYKGLHSSSIQAINSVLSIFIAVILLLGSVADVKLNVVAQIKSLLFRSTDHFFYNFESTPTQKDGLRSICFYTGKAGRKG